MRIVYSRANYAHDHEGTKFTIPSPTQPDLSFSVKQLVAEHSVGALPSLASLQEFFDDDEDMEGHNDVRFADKADALEKYLAANEIRRSVFEKLKSMHDFKKKQELEELGKYRRTYGSLPDIDDKK